MAPCIYSGPCEAQLENAVVCTGKEAVELLQKETGMMARTCSTAENYTYMQQRTDSYNNQYMIKQFLSMTN